MVSLMRSETRLPWSCCSVIQIEGLIMMKYYGLNLNAPSVQLIFIIRNQIKVSLPVLILSLSHIMSIDFALQHYFFIPLLDYCHLSHCFQRISETYVCLCMLGSLHPHENDTGRIIQLNCQYHNDSNTHAANRESGYLA